MQDKPGRPEVVPLSLQERIRVLNSAFCAVNTHSCQMLIGEDGFSMANGHSFRDNLDIDKIPSKGQINYKSNGQRDVHRRIRLQVSMWSNVTSLFD